MAGRLARGLGWSVVGLLAFFALMRIVAWDALEPFIVVNALTMLVYLPAWIVALGAALSKRWLLCGAAVVVVAAQIAFVAPELLAASPLPGWVKGAPTLRIFDANVDKSTDFRSGYSAAIERYRPDVITLEEFTPAGWHNLVRSGALRTFPFRCVAPQYGATGFLVASRLPMTGCRVHSVRWDDLPTPYMVSAVIHADGVRVQLRVVHTLAPFPSSWREWASALRAVDTMVRQGSPQEMLMVGDFNATWNNRGFAALLGDGLTDAAAARGQDFAMTWPNGAIVPPFIRIDHVLTGSRLAATVITSHSGFGSDHHFLTTSIALHP